MRTDGNGQLEKNSYLRWFGRKLTSILFFFGKETMLWSGDGSKDAGQLTLDVTASFTILLRPFHIYFLLLGVRLFLSS